MGMATRILILDDADCLLHSANILESGMSPAVLPPAMSK